MTIVDGFGCILNMHLYFSAGGDEELDEVRIAGFDGGH